MTIGTRDSALKPWIIDLMRNVTSSNDAIDDYHRSVAIKVASSSALDFSAMQPEEIDAIISLIYDCKGYEDEKANLAVDSLIANKLK